MMQFPIANIEIEELGLEAMISHRPYRPGLSIDRAFEEIEQNRGTLYDPDAVEACMRVVGKLKGL